MNRLYLKYLKYRLSLSCLMSLKIRLYLSYLMNQSYLNYRLSLSYLKYLKNQKYRLNR